MITEIEMCQKPDRQGGLVAKGALAYARASDTLSLAILVTFRV